VCIALMVAMAVAAVTAIVVVALVVMPAIKRQVEPTCPGNVATPRTRLHHVDALSATKPPIARKHEGFHATHH
jgi:hypothetical protein